MATESGGTGEGEEATAAFRLRGSGSVSRANYIWQEKTKSQGCREE